jgi:hypothetical protein
MLSLGLVEKIKQEGKTFYVLKEHWIKNSEWVDLLFTRTEKRKLVYEVRRAIIDLSSQLNIWKYVDRQFTQILEDNVSFIESLRSAGFDVDNISRANLLDLIKEHLSAPFCAECLVQRKRIVHSVCDL